MEKENFAQTYGVKHSRFYKKSPVSDYLNELNEDGRVIKRHSDVHLLLRQKRLQETIGVDSIRSYISSMVAPQSNVPMPDLSDKELLELIPPKDVNNLTTSHLYAKYLQANQDKIKENYKRKLEENKYYEKALKRFFGEKDDSK